MGQVQAVERSCDSGVVRLTKGFGDGGPKVLATFATVFVAD